MHSGAMPTGVESSTDSPVVELSIEVSSEVWMRSLEGELRKPTNFPVLLLVEGEGSSSSIMIGVFIQLLITMVLPGGELRLKALPFLK